jgi:hypothetical protein
MCSRGISFTAISAVCLASVICLQAFLLDSRAADSAAAPEVELEGRVVCIPERIHELFDTELPAEHEHVYGFETRDGALYSLLRTKFSDALFIDQELRKRELLLKGRIFPKSHIFEVTRTRSIKAGQVYDVFYFCSVCNIETVSAGPCPCCQGAVELRERILPESKR